MPILQEFTTLWTGAVYPGRVFPPTETSISPCDPKTGAADDAPPWNGDAVCEDGRCRYPLKFKRSDGAGQWRVNRPHALEELRNVFAQYITRYWPLKEDVCPSFDGQVPLIWRVMLVSTMMGTVVVRVWILKRRVNSRPLMEPAQCPSVTTMSVGLVVAI